MTHPDGMTNTPPHAERVLRHTQSSARRAPALQRRIRHRRRRIGLPRNILNERVIVASLATWNDTSARLPTRRLHRPYGHRVTARRTLGSGTQGPRGIRASQAGFLGALPGIRLTGSGRR